MRWYALVGLLAGCDRVFALTHVGSAGPDAPPGVDVDAATICAHDAPFTTMTPVPGLADGTLAEIDLALTDDELSAIVTLGGPNFTSKLAFAKRTALDQPFTLGSDLAVDLRSTAIGSATLTPDGRTMYYEAFYSSTSGFDVERATSSSAGADFMNAQSVAELNASGGIYDESPTLNHDGTRIYWESSRSGEYDVMTAVWDGVAWTNAAQIYAATMRYERFFVPSDDDLALYFGSSANGLGNYELRVVTRSRLDQTFGSPALITLPMTVSSATPSWLSADHCRMYLSTGGDMWLATRTP